MYSLSNPAVMKRYWLPLWLGLFTLLAFLPWQPQGPFDARDWSTIEGVTVLMPWQGAIIEPFVALFHIITGAPDFRLAAISFALWSTLLGGVWAYRSLRGRGAWRRGLWSAGAALFGFWLVPALMLFFSHVHFPGWQLQLDDPQWLAADLQSHTVGSHDGLVRASYSLKWHRQRGYDVVGVTEHDDPKGSYFAEVLSERTGGPTVIPGIEVANEYNGFLLGVGLNPDKPVPPRWKRGEPDYSRQFTRAVDQGHGGAVISLAWRLQPEDIEALADAGVNAFELMNQGHPDIPDAVRNEMLRLEREGRIRLLSSTDWHGWGGTTRTWTLLHLPGWSKMSDEQRRQGVVTLLREGKSSDVIPLVAGYQGTPGVLRTLFAPLVETARYAAELSPLRLLSWWFWAGVLWLLARRIRAAGYAPRPLYASLGLLLVGGLLFWRGTQLWQIGVEQDVVLCNVGEELGAMAMQAATPLILLGGWLLWRFITIRNRVGQE
jgi:hypothetical protein